MCERMPNRADQGSYFIQLPTDALLNSNCEALPGRSLLYGSKEPSLPIRTSNGDQTTIARIGRQKRFDFRPS